MLRKPVQADNRLASFSAENAVLPSRAFKNARAPKWRLAKKSSFVKLFI